MPIGREWGEWATFSDHTLFSAIFRARVKYILFRMGRGGMFFFLSCIRGEGETLGIASRFFVRADNFGRIIHTILGFR